MLWVPEVRVLIDTDAFPEALIVAVPRTTAPSVNVTCPVRVPAPVAEVVATTVELNVSIAPAEIGFWLGVRDVEVEIC